MNIEKEYIENEFKYDTANQICFLTINHKIKFLEVLSIFLGDVNNQTR